MNILQAENISKSFGAKILFENISFSINKKDKVGLIAENGAGKSTLLKILRAEEPADSGTVRLDSSYRTSYLPQEAVFDGELSVSEQVFQKTDTLSSAIKSYHNAMNFGDKEDLQKAVNEMDRLEAWDYERRIEEILEKLKVNISDGSVAYLSGGQKKRLALASALINKPQFLILDEPTNHLDYGMIEWLEKELTKSHISLLLVTHDRYFLDNVCNRIIEIDDKQLFNYTGSYADFLKKRAERIKQKETDIHNAQKLLKKESEWMNRMPKARGTKAKARINRFYETKEQASRKIDDSSIDIQTHSSRLGKKIIDIYNLSKSFGELKIIEDFSYKFNRFEKIAIVGNNGTGKTSFLKLLTGELLPDSGTIDIGKTVIFGFYKQEGMKIPEDARVIDIITNIADHIKLRDDYILSAAQFLEKFLFPRSAHYEAVGKLSGGQKRRLYLMTVLMKKPNFLILDEPTNDFDIATLNVLEDFLQNYQANVLVVSHDRYFTDKLAHTLFIFEGDGKVKVFPGNYTDYKIYLKNSRKEEKKTQKVKSPTPKKASKSNNKMSYKEKCEFEQLEVELEKLQLKKKMIETELNSGKLKHKELHEKSISLQKLSDLIDEKEFRWLELSEKDV